MVVVRRGGWYYLYSKKVNPKTGRRRKLGRARSRAGILKRERQVQYFKHMRGRRPASVRGYPRWVMTRAQNRPKLVRSFTVANNYDDFSGLPSPNQIPKVPGEWIEKLYKQYVEMKQVDEELLEETVSRLIARAEVWLRLNDAYWFPYDEGLHNLDEKRHDDAFMTLMDIYDFGASASQGNLRPSYEGLKRWRGSSIDKRMLALDSFIHVVHDAGPLAGNFIDAWDPEEFLNALASWSRRV